MIVEEGILMMMEDTLQDKVTNLRDEQTPGTDEHSKATKDVTAIAEAIVNIRKAEAESKTKKKQTTLDTVMKTLSLCIPVAASFGLGLLNFRYQTSLSKFWADFDLTGTVTSTGGKSFIRNLFTTNPFK